MKYLMLYSNKEAKNEKSLCSVLSSNLFRSLSATSLDLMLHEVRQLGKYHHRVISDNPIGF